MSELLKAKIALYWALMDADVEVALTQDTYLKALMDDAEVMDVLRKGMSKEKP